MIFNFFDKRTLFAGLLMACSTFLTPIAQSAPGFTYEAIYIDGQFPNQNLIVQHGAINNSRQVVFTTAETIGFNSQILRTYVATPGQAPQLIFASPSWTGQDPDPHIYQSENGIGINDNGIVAVGVIRSIFENGARVRDDIGYRLCEPDRLCEPAVGLIREIPVLRKSTGHLNNSLQMGGTSGPNFVVTDGITSTSTNAAGVVGLQEVNVNQSGAVASGGFLPIQGANQQTAVVSATPPGASQAVTIGDRFGLGYVSFAISAGFNDLGWMSTATNTDGLMANPNPRVLLVSPTGVLSVVAETANSDFVNFRQPAQAIGAGVSLNRFNRVSFAAQSADGSDSIWIGDASGSQPRLAVDSEIEFTDGRSISISGYSNDVTHHATNSLNDVSEISVIGTGTLFDENGNVLASQTKALFVARPAVGTEPGNAILPDPNDVQPIRGFRLRWRGFRPLRTTFGRFFPRRFNWFDPPVAVGYDYAIDDASDGAFTWVLIPVPLPGGDGAFTIEVNGTSAPLLAGIPFELATIAADAVRTFRISGIDPSEDVDPEDPAAFVTGLTFVEGTDEDVSFTMIPIIENPDGGVCGDSMLDSGEMCDDGNTANGDGCDASCQVEAGFECTLPAPGPTPSICTAITDSDDDGVPDSDDFCPGTAPGADVDAFGCSAEQLDADDDGINNGDDNCPDDANPGQEDNDNDSIGDACDDDVDGDGVLNDDDNCPVDANSNQDDFDMDGTGDACDTDDDDDGVADGADACAETKIPELNVPRAVLKKNRYVLSGDPNNTTFQSRNKTVFTTADTEGCSCEQIIGELGLGGGQIMFGCSKSAMQQWIDRP